MKAFYATLALAGLALAGCGSSSGITTGSLLGEGGAKAAQAAPVVVTPTDRALQVSTTSARAERCGFYFDPARLRTNFLAAEANSGLAASEMQRIEREYDSIRGKLAAVIAQDGGFCTDAKAREIKADLNRHLAGDFTPSAKQSRTGGGWLDDMNNAARTREVFNPDYMNDPLGKKTKKVEY